MQETAPCSPGREVEESQDQLIWVNYLLFILITIPTVVTIVLIRFAQYLSALQVRFLWGYVSQGPRISGGGPGGGGSTEHSSPAALWIRTGFNADPNPLYLNADLYPDPDPGSKPMILVRVKSRKKFNFYMKNIPDFSLVIGEHTYEGAKAFWKDRKQGLFLNFGQFPCSWIRIRIPNRDLDPGQPNECGSGSTSLLTSMNTLLSLLLLLYRSRPWIELRVRLSWRSRGQRRSGGGPSTSRSPLAWAITSGQVVQPSLKGTV